MQQESCVRIRIWYYVNQSELFEIRRGDGQRHRVADGFMEAIVSAIAIEKRLARIGHLVIVVTKLMMHYGEIFLRNLNAHLESHVLFVVDVPGARMTNYFMISGLAEH